MEDDWDLQAVVRGCCGSSSTTTTTNNNNNNTTHFPTWGFEEREDLLCFPDLFETKTALEELEQLYRPFLPKFQVPIASPSNPISPLSNLRNPISPLSNLSNPISVPPLIKQEHQQQQPRRSSSSTSTMTPRPKRRKNQQKKVVCQVPAEGLSSDMWAWRKYGQKPIKGSPYPRGYYRCSSSKGCLARKQVERSRTDPGMFIITYTAEHNHPVPTHRNSLAGSTRNKLSTPQNPSTPPSSSTTTTATTTSISKPSTSSPMGLSPTTPLTTSMEEEEDDELLIQQRKQEEEEDDDLGISKLQGLMADDLFMELDELVGAGNAPAAFGDCFTSSNWFAATAAGGI